MIQRYLIETHSDSAECRDLAIEVSARRFPEVELEHCYVGRGIPIVIVWICRAPSDAHVRRWLGASGLTPTLVRQVDHETVTTVRPSW